MSSVHSVNAAAKGTKLWLLHLGDLEADAGWFKRGGATSTKSNPAGDRERRTLAVIAALIEHPVEGLILFETGCGKNHPEVWGAPLNDIFAQVNYDPEQDLPNAIKKTGHDIKDVKAVVMGHLHLDHAGGLSENFKGTDVPVYCHEEEIKNAFYSVATSTDLGVYLPKDLDMSLNWKGWHGDSLELAQGITLMHMPGHTPGLSILQLNLEDSGTWILTTDQYHVTENYFADVPQGWLARDHEEWVRSHQKIRAIAKRTDAKLIFGHCKETLMQYKIAPESYT